MHMIVKGAAFLALLALPAYGAATDTTPGNNAANCPMMGGMMAQNMKAMMADMDGMMKDADLPMRARMQKMHEQMATMMTHMQQMGSPMMQHGAGQNAAPSEPAPANPADPHHPAN